MIGPGFKSEHRLVRFSVLRGKGTLKKRRKKAMMSVLKMLLRPDCDGSLTQQKAIWICFSPNMLNNFFIEKHDPAIFTSSLFPTATAQLEPSKKRACRCTRVNIHRRPTHTFLFGPSTVYCYISAPSSSLVRFRLIRKTD